GLGSLDSIGQQTFRRNLCAWIGRTPIAREVPHDTQALRPHHRLYGRWLLCPGERQLGCNVGGTVLSHEFCEGRQLLAGPIQLESQAATQVQIFPDGLTERGHRTPLGHGRAKARKESRSTFVSIFVVSGL